MPPYKYITKQNFKRSATLDYLKAICIIFVVLTHSYLPHLDKKTWLFPFWVDMAVPIFMIISGYVFTLSVQSKQVSEFSAYFSPSFFIPKFLRFFLPFLVFFCTELLILKYVVGYTTIPRIGYLFLTGGVFGPGSYYVPILMQFLCAFPLMWLLIKGKHACLGIVILLIIQILLEYVFVWLNINLYIYRLMFFRYGSFVVAGIVLALFPLASKWIATSFFLGATYIFLANYTSWHPTLFYGWKVTSMPTVLYAAPLVWLALKLNDFLLKPSIFPALIGKASYHIFLVQTCYFTFFAVKLENPISQLMLNFTLCVGVGIIFYLFCKGLKHIIKSCFFLGKLRRLKAKKTHETI